jgi:hypothetical protein
LTQVQALPWNAHPEPTLPLGKNGFNQSCHAQNHLLDLIVSEIRVKVLVAVVGFQWTKISTSLPGDEDPGESREPYSEVYAKDPSHF